MQIALTEPQEDFIRQAVSEGRYASEAQIVTLGLRMVEEHDRKLADLRAMIAESLADDKVYTPEEMDQFFAEQDSELTAQGFTE